jgi:hypothetical protein
MTTPVFLATDETACDDDRALTAEHGRRIVRNALAIWNERCGHVGHSERLVDDAGADVTTRAIITAGWAYVGPIHYFCPAPVGESNSTRPQPFVRLLLTGRKDGAGTFSAVYAVNQSVNPPSEVQMEDNILSGPGASWYVLPVAATWSATLEVPVAPGWNIIWLGFKCHRYGELTSLVYSEDGNNYYPFVAEFTRSNATNGSHPALLAPNVGNTDAPAMCIIVAPTMADFAAGRIGVYTVPMILTNTIKDPVLSDGVYLLWEPFGAELAATAGASITSNLWTGTQDVLPVVAYYQALDVINLDSMTIDGSQVWQTEDVQNGAGLRWWQLPSAFQNRQAANLAQKARIAVCPMLKCMSPVIGTQVYPLATTGGKPRSWRLANGIGLAQDALLQLATDLPFSQPVDLVTLEVSVSVCVFYLRRNVSVNQVQVDLTVELYNLDTLALLASATQTDVVGVIQPGAGSLNGSSIIARTVGWATAFSLPGSLTRYGQEGLTRRNDWRVWRTMQATITVDRADLAGAGFFFTHNASVVIPAAGITNADFYVAISDGGVRIVGD